MKSKLFPILFLIVFVVELFSIYTDNNSLRMISKPLIIPVLAVWLIVSTQLKGRFHKNIFIGLIMAWFGDILLMFDSQSEMYFIFGLIAFLFCHIFYIRAFLLDHKSNPNQKNPYFFISLGVFSVICGTLFFYLQPKLGGMQFPVLIYAIVISIMAIMAVNRYRKVNFYSFKLILFGAVLYLISDSTLACNKFGSALPYAGLIIMSTYMLAQWLIVYGTITRELIVKQTEI